MASHFRSAPGEAGPDEPVPSMAGTRKRLPTDGAAAQVPPSERHGPSVPHDRSVPADVSPQQPSPEPTGPSVTPTDSEPTGQDAPVSDPRAGRRRRVLAVLVLALALVLGFLVGSCVGGRRRADVVAPFTDPAAEPATPGSVSIPGYEALELAADTTRQEVSLPNPAANECLMRMSLELADGEVVWEGAPLEPGHAFTAIELARPLPAGTYAATLRCACLSPVDGSPLNGADIKLELRVR